MDTLEVNIKLKEDIKILETMYSELMKEYKSYVNVPHIIYGNLKILNLLCLERSEQVKAQKGIESTQSKFDTVEGFANFVNGLMSFNIKHLEEKFNCK